MREFQPSPPPPFPSSPHFLLPPSLLPSSEDLSTSSEAYPSPMVSSPVPATPLAFPPPQTIRFQPRSTILSLSFAISLKFLEWFFFFQNQIYEFQDAPPLDTPPHRDLKPFRVVPPSTVSLSSQHAPTCGKPHVMFDNPHCLSPLFSISYGASQPPNTHCRCMVLTLQRVAYMRRSFSAPLPPDFLL